MGFSDFDKNGFIQINIRVSESIKGYIKERDYIALDEYFRVSLHKGGDLHNELSNFIKIEKTEHIISIRSGENDEEGIWHDDGSRKLAFTLSLVEDLDQLVGGALLFRNKLTPDKIISIATAPYGTLTIIKTGCEGYEHRVQKVEEGMRIICAGWIN